MIYVEWLNLNQKVYAKSINNVNIPETLWNVKAIKRYIFKSLNNFLNQRFYFTGVWKPPQFFLRKDESVIDRNFKNTSCRLFQYDIGAKDPF